MTGMSRMLPWLVVAAAAVFFFSVSMAPAERDGGYRLDEFARLPVADHGRIKPMDSVARLNLMTVSNKQTAKGMDGKPASAVRWQLDIMTSRMNQKSRAEEYEVFRIDNEQVIRLLQLKEKPLFWRYSIQELADKADVIEKEGLRAAEMREAGKELDLFDKKILELYEHLQLYMNLAQWRIPAPVPPADGDGQWRPFLSVIHEMRQGKEDDAYGRAYGSMLLAYGQGQPEQFNRELATCQKVLAERYPEDVRKANLEVLFNQMTPFYHCALLYVGVFLLSCFSWVAYAEPLRRSAFWLAAFTFLIHTVAILLRIYLSGRPPVTNIYSAAIFVGWCSVLLGLVLERLYKNGTGTALAAVAGSLTLIVAHNFATDDTLAVLQAVLDTNFWLATHVTIITFGYAATYVAGILGAFLILRGVLTPSLDTKAYRTLGQMIYAVVCFATLLSFTGTVLGGLWADYSWGRFWGWDPKENGALIIVLWNALVLHARWGGMVGQRGMAVLALFGNIVTTWSFFGVNQLGVGLHSYGFMSGVAFWMGVFIVGNLGLMALGMTPLRHWRSFAAAGTANPVQHAKPGGANGSYAKRQAVTEAAS
jgi:ABC-type transport system involved in cytochrome c biogenesis permease subunit